jgi:hypothetical protein
MRTSREHWHSSTTIHHCGDAKVTGNTARSDILSNLVALPYQGQGGGYSSLSYKGDSDSFSLARKASDQYTLVDMPNSGR